MRRDRCRTVEIDGELIRVYGEKPPSAEDIAALAEIVKALRKRHAEKADALATAKS